jgi:hypothetical protein
MSGQRLALTIGINDYQEIGASLTGCVNDANGWRDALERRGFSVHHMTDGQATLSAMREAIADLVATTRYGDIAVITYSGHGTWVPDMDKDEPDGRDEALVPHDVLSNGVLTDDDLHDLFSERHSGARLVMISDSCHSGTVNRFAGPITTDRPRVRYVAPEVHLMSEELPAARAVAAMPPRGKSRPSALLMAGCKDLEYSYDGIGNAQMGAFSYVALNTLARLPEGATYRDWLAQIRLVLPAADLPQTPQLSGTRSQLNWPVFEPQARR